MLTDTLTEARKVADAVLFEGYVLYPYRASAVKNQVRFQFGVLMPESFVAIDPHEASASRTEILLEPADGAVLTVETRFLHVQQRLVSGDTGLVPWDEGVVETVTETVPLSALPLSRSFSVPFDEVVDSIGSGVVTRRRLAVSGRLSVTADALPGPYGVVRLRVDVVNTSECSATVRESAVRSALVASHSLLTISGGRFISMLEPPEWARAMVAACENERTFPVLVGEDVVLSSPIILYDHPRIAPESQGDLFDATEIDEILTLRTMTLTDEEKKEVRGTDPRAADLLDRVDSMPQELLDRLHGSIRYLRAVTGPAAPAAVADDVPTFGLPDTPWWDPGNEAAVNPETDSVLVDGVRVANGSRVLLRPRAVGTDAQDIFLAGQAATVHAVVFDVDGQTHVAVTVDDDPIAELQFAERRFLYFRPDEIEPIR